MKYKVMQLLLLIMVLSGSFAYAQNQESTPFVNNLSVEEKRALRTQLLNQLIVKYNQNQTFTKMHEYMILKYREKGKAGPSHLPDVIISEALERSRTVYEKTRSFFGNNFKRLYQPEQIETSIHKYLWLKGLCFLMLGIGEEHKLAVSFFYLPANETLKKEFLKDAVRYSYPEVPDIPENQAWFQSMNGVMDRLAYKVFNVDQYVSTSTQPGS